MVRLTVVGALLLAAGVLSTERTWPHKIADKEFLARQVDVFHLFYHVYQPTVHQHIHDISTTWDLKKNIEHFHNTTAVNRFYKMWKDGMLVSRDEIVNSIDEDFETEVQSLFNLLYSAKDFDTLFKCACWVRDHVHPHTFVYALSTAIIHRHDTQGIILPPIYEIFPNYFLNGEIMNLVNIASKIGEKIVDVSEHTHLWDNNIVIDANATYWHYWSNDDFDVAYLTNDIDWNAFYYYLNMDYPSWLGQETCPLIKDRRGEFWWFAHQQIVARYYMERLSNGLGEIEDISWLSPITTGFTSGLIYENGVRFPERMNNFDVTSQPIFLPWITLVNDAERRIRDAIDLGYVITDTGDHISLKEPESIDVLGRLIDGNVDSPNTRFYYDIVGIWKKILGNSVQWQNIPSALEHYTTAMRDPAFYQIWKRVLLIFQKFQEHLPMYTSEQLALPGVVIEKVDVDKLVTYFENFHVNVTNALWMSKEEIMDKQTHHSVVVRQARLNHKLFKVRVNVKSEIAKTVVVKFFLAPKYDSLGNILPLTINRMNFVELDMFKFDLKQGDNVIIRDSNDFVYIREDFTSSHELYWKMIDAFNGTGQFPLDMSEGHNHVAKRLLLPKGTRAGMPFNFLVYIHEFHAPKVEYGTGFDWKITTGLGSGARYMTNTPFGFPLERPVDWNVLDLGNFHMEDVAIFHKPTPELNIHYNY